MACHVIPASGRLVDVDIPELSESTWPGIGIFSTSMGLGRQIVEELEGIMGRGSVVQISVRPKVTLSRLFINILCTLLQLS